MANAELQHQEGFQYDPHTPPSVGDTGLIWTVMLE
jgi:hypothetical protein